MAKMTISLPDDLKARMDSEGKSNWSRVAKQAFEIELDATVKKGSDMNSAIERLRASRSKSEESGRATWFQQGRSWATDEAEYEQLERIGEADLDALDDKHDRTSVDLLKFLGEVLYEDTSRTGIEEAVEFLAGDAGRVSARQTRWFLDGVQAVWQEVKGEI